MILLLTPLQFPGKTSKAILHSPFFSNQSSTEKTYSLGFKIVVIITTLYDITVKAIELPHKENLHSKI